jgi:replicative DNA helicase
VVSLPSATPSKQIWENCKNYLDSFQKIVLSVDNDEAGNSIADRISKLFPNKVYRVAHGKYKDANDFLTNRSMVEFKQAWYNAKKYTPDNVLNTTDQFLKLYDETPELQYVPTGINELDAKILGLMQGHFTVIKAPTGIGKTEIMRYLEYNMIQRGVRIATWHLEETKLRSVLGLVSYELNDNMTRRDLIEQKDADGLVRGAIRSLTETENYYQFFLEDGQGADDLCDQIRFFSQACDCKFVFFEPIQDVVTGSSEESKEQQLADLSVRLSKMAADLNVGIVTIAHTNENGDPKYCKMIGQRASVIIDLNRDKDAETVEEKNTTYIKVEKNRPCSQEGPAGKMKFNYDTFTLREVL